MKKFFNNVLVFFLLTVSITGDHNEFFSDYSIYALLIPYNVNTGSINIYLMALNLGVIITFIYNLIKSTDEHFKMEQYILTRGTPHIFYFLYIKKIMKVVLSLLIAILLVAIVFSMKSNFENFSSMILLLVSILITALLWSFIIFALRLHKVKISFIYFISVFLIVTSQVLSFYHPFFSLFVMASINFFDTFLLLIIGKLVACKILFLYNFFAVIKYEALGE